MATAWRRILQWHRVVLAEWCRISIQNMFHTSCDQPKLSLHSVRYWFLKTLEAQAAVVKFKDESFFHHLRSNFAEGPSLTKSIPFVKPTTPGKTMQNFVWCNIWSVNGNCKSFLNLNLIESEYLDLAGLGLHARTALTSIAFTKPATPQAIPWTSNQISTPCHHDNRIGRPPSPPRCALAASVKCSKRSEKTRKYRTCKTLAHWKRWCSICFDDVTCALGCGTSSSFFWLFLFLSSTLLSSLFYSSLFYSSHLCFSSLHIAGSLTSKLPLKIISNERQAKFKWSQGALWGHRYRFS